MELELSCRESFRSLDDDAPQIDRSFFEIFACSRLNKLIQMGLVEYLVLYLGTWLICACGSMCNCLAVGWYVLTVAGKLQTRHWLLRSHIVHTCSSCLVTSKQNAISIRI